MKLTDFEADASLNRLRRGMGASLAEPYSEQPRLPKIELSRKLRAEGVEISVDEIETLDDGTLAYQGHRVLVYIRDVSRYGGRIHTPRFHVSDCQTLEQMKQARRWDRYVVSNRDDGQFVVNVVGESTGLMELNVCQNCLKKLSWKGFSDSLPRQHRQKIVAEFELPEFFADYPRDLMQKVPGQTTGTAPINDYPADWPEISRLMKSDANFSCQQCHAQLVGRRSKFLDVHHRNGQKNDCHPENLEVVCINCHATKPMHEHLRRDQRYQDFHDLKSCGGL